MSITSCNFERLNDLIKNKQYFSVLCVLQIHTFNTEQMIRQQRHRAAIKGNDMDTPVTDDKKRFFIVMNKMP